MSDSGLLSPSPDTALPDPAEAKNVAYNPSPGRLREFSRELETTTEFSSPAYVSEQRSRCSDRTKNAIDDEFDADDLAHVETALEYAQTHEMVCVDRRIGRHPDHTYVGRYYVPKKYARIALAVTNLFEPAETGAAPDFLTVQVPEADEIAIRVLPESGVTAVLGSDYSGEAKKSFLRLFMRRTKEAGGLGLHAGSKRVTLENDADELQDVGQVFLGLSATGKSTLTAHGLWLDEPESATMLQDDVCALLPDGTVAGSEGNGLYIKTIGLDRDEQPAMYDAATHESAILENVAVDAAGTVDFDSGEHTTNGRAVIRREHLSSAGEDIDLDRVDQVFFITRNPVMPPVAKLSPEEAAVAFMLGESIQTSAGDPSKAGESIRVVGTNPFIMGSEGAEGNRFRDLIADLDLDCFVLNTGHLGDRAKDIGVEDSVTLLREIARGTVEWTVDESIGLTIPASVPGMDIEQFAVSDHVEDCEEKLADLRAERRAYLAAFEELDNEIEAAVY
ncbi:phosphoenolpyruvate carboxykinase (ATP) [Natronomonas salsuginis]|uniref:phosphoenolpyruvate carboxykinase (ATP) n=1 Tax=Natronomonas salsuginis TaxID=2217661 RepID=A0A4U5JAE6_9EURY|nr:phosphoenolpyruvate carboxykinase (ATP) [Natronomonas salsuginis]TKR25774.1 phosphoenolpyruvate carboxykinase (ATP) [Natronomonas salsuginis]